MIKNKKSTYILIPIVLIIWVIIIVQIFFNNSKTEEHIVGFKENAKSNVLENLYSENYSINLSNRDPFGMKTKVISSSPISNKSSISRRKLNVKIKYYGFIKKGSELWANISVNNKFFIAKVNQQIDEFTVNRITSDSIVVKLENGENYVIIK